MLYSTCVRQREEAAATGAIFMRNLRTLLPLALLLALFAAACGGSSPKVPRDAVARVGGDKITKAQFDAVLGRAREGDKTPKRPLPGARTPADHQNKASGLQVLAPRAA